MKIDYSNLDKYLADVHEAMKPLQIKCVSHLKKNVRCIVDSYMGTGKTLMVLTATFLRRPQKVLILCSVNALWTWKKEILKWYPAYGQAGMYRVITGSPAQRAVLWSKDTLFYVTTYASARNDIEHIMAQDFDVCIMDEFHRSGLRQHIIEKKRSMDHKTGKAVKTLTGFGIFRKLKPIPVIYPASGTVISRGPQDAWPVLHILDDKMFPSYWKFVNTFCIVEDGMFGKQILGPQNTEGLARATRPYWYKVPREEAEASLPPITKRLIPIEMSPTQRKMYRAFEEEMFYELANGDLSVASTSLGASIRLRQLLACPKIIDPAVDDYGAAIETIVDMAKDNEDPHIVVFTPFRPAVTYLKEYIAANLTKDVYHIWGGLEPEDLHGRITAWKKSKGAMVCTVQFSQSFELETSNNCYYAGYEWDQNDNDQASSRLRRMINPRPVFANYMQYQDTIDVQMLEVLNSKTRNVRITTQDFWNMIKPTMEKKYAK